MFISQMLIVTIHVVNHNLQIIIHAIIMLKKVEMSYELFVIICNRKLTSYVF